MDSALDSLEVKDSVGIMPSVQSLFEGSEKLVSRFNSWPNFHDAEVIELHIWRGDIDKERDRWISPVLTLKLRVIGHTSGTLDQLVTLRFHDVEDFKTECFNHQNAIYDLRVAIEERTTDNQPLPSYRAVRFDGESGMCVSFKCSRIEILDAVPWAPETTRTS